MSSFMPSSVIHRAPLEATEPFCSAQAQTRSDRMRRQRGSNSMSNVMAMLIFVLLLYAGAKVGPLYLEQYRIGQAAQAAANQWVNVTPNLRVVQDDLQTRLDAAKIKRLAATDFSFSRVTDSEVQVEVRYTATIRHPYDVVKPSKMNFTIRKSATRSLSISE